jgi:zeta-carotene desaturase
MSDVIVLGGGLAGLSAAAALGGAGHSVTILEARPFLGGRATSYEIGEESIDNCQHVLLRCCVNLLDFYRRLGVEGKIAFHREYTFIEPGGRRSVLRPGLLPAPAHFFGSFLGLSFLSLREKLAVGGAMRAILRESGTRTDLDRITMQQWLEEKKQPPRACTCSSRTCWGSAERGAGRMAASYGLHVFRQGFPAGVNPTRWACRVPLGDLYAATHGSRLM